LETTKYKLLFKNGIFHENYFKNSARRKFMQNIQKREKDIKNKMRNWSSKELRELRKLRNVKRMN